MSRRWHPYFLFVAIVFVSVSIAHGQAAAEYGAMTAKMGAATAAAAKVPLPTIVIPVAVRHRQARNHRRLRRRPRQAPRRACQPRTKLLLRIDLAWKGVQGRKPRIFHSLPSRNTRRSLSILSS